MGDLFGSPNCYGQDNQKCLLFDGYLLCMIWLTKIAGRSWCRQHEGTVNIVHLHILYTTHIEMTQNGLESSKLPL